MSPASSGPVGVSGSSGLVGRRLLVRLAREGRPAVRLARGVETAGAGTASWDPARGTIDAAALEGLQAFVHLAGESIAAGRWTARRKARIRDSRVDGTRVVAEALAGLGRPPRALVSASAIGFYGDRGDEPLDERSPAGCGFLPETCAAWEAATEPAREAGIRVVCLRIGIVLDARGGALARMLPPFRLGLGGRIGHGRQYMSWIALDDLVGVILRAIDDARLAGPVNAVAPQPVRNAEFAAALGRVLRRPARLPLPGAVVRLLLGEMGRDLLLAGARVRPARLAESGFAFEHPEIEAALGRLLAR